MSLFLVSLLSILLIVSCTLCVLLGLPPFHSIPINLMLIGCLMRALLLLPFPSSLFLFLFLPSLSLEHIVDIHKPLSGNHQGPRFFKLIYCLSAHDTALMEYNPSLYYITALIWAYTGCRRVPNRS